MYCNNCKVLDKKMIYPKGSYKPDLYIIFNHPTVDDISSGDGYMSKPKIYLNNLLSTINNVQLRYFYISRCNISDYDDYEDISDVCKCFLYNDIKKTNPKSLVTVGLEATNLLLNTNYVSILDIVDKVFKMNIEGKDYNIFPIHDPKDIIEESREDILIAKRYLNCIRNLCNPINPIDNNTIKSTNSNNNNINPINNNIIDNSKFIKQKLQDKYKIYVARTFTEFKDYVEKYLKDSDQIGFDIETNAKIPFDIDSEIVGYSIANRDSGIYVILKSIDYKMPLTDIDLCKDLLINLFKSKKVVVHNSMYERPYVLAKYGYELPFNTTDDTLMMARLMLEGQYGANLKRQCEINLNFEDWSKDLDLYINIIKSLVDTVKSNKFLLDDIVKKSYEELLKIDNINFTSNIINLFKLLESYYNFDERLDLLKSIMKSIIKLYYENNIDNEFSFEHIPSRLISKYGAIDSIATLALYDYYMDIMTKESTLTIDLHKGYKLYLEHAYAGYIFERNGLYWNEKASIIDGEKMLAAALESHKNMLLVSSMESYLCEKLFYMYAPEIILEKFPYIITNAGYSMKQTTYRQNLVYKLYDNNSKKSYHIKHFEKLIPISESEKNLINPLVLSQVRADIQSKTHYEELKQFFNPSSTTESSRKLVESILITKDFKIARFIFNLRPFVTNPDFDLDRIHYKSDKMICKLVKDISDAQYVKDNFDDRVKLFNELKTVLFTPGLITRIKDIQKALGDAFNFVLETTSNEYIIDIFTAYMFMGINSEDSSAWTPEFKFLVNFRIYKKSTKLITTYILGKVGRQSVYIAKKSDMESGDLIVPRLARYGSRELKSDEDYLMQSSFKVNTAETGRWQCLHGETLIPLANGNVSKIKDLVDIGEFDIYGYSDLNGIVITKGICKKSGEDSPTITIELNNGKNVVCTPEHLVMLSNGSYIRADKLKTHMSLMPFSRRKFKNGNINVYDLKSNLWIYYSSKNLKELFRISNEFNMNNVRIVSIRESENSDVYDIKVDETHNFALDAGVIVHNSGLHILPWGSTVKTYYSSRFKGGTILAPDYSQNELRCLAAAANEQTMLEAFKRGEDIHKFSASMIFDKSINDVSDAERRHAKMASFSIVFGSEEDTFAFNYLDGDIKRARMIFRGFFEKFPNIKKFIDSKHTELLKTGRVSLLTNRYIKINYNKNVAMEVSAAKRCAQNYPIQGSSSDVVGSVAFEICKYIEERKFKSKPIMFVHDSIESDIYPYELFELVSKFRILLNQIPLEKFNIPCSSGISLGKSFGHEHELLDIKCNNDFTRAELTLEGYKDELSETLDNWKQVYSKVDVIEEEKWKEVYNPYSDIFIVKKTYNPWIGKIKEKGKIVVAIEY